MIQYHNVQNETLLSPLGNKMLAIKLNVKPEIDFG